VALLYRHVLFIYRLPLPLIVKAESRPGSSPVILPPVLTAKSTPSCLSSQSGGAVVMLSTIHTSPSSNEVSIGPRMLANDSEPLPTAQLTANVADLSVPADVGVVSSTTSQSSSAVTNIAAADVSNSTVSNSNGAAVDRKANSAKVKDAVSEKRAPSAAVQSDAVTADAFSVKSSLLLSANNPEQKYVYFYVHIPC
jgi:hypothetical protein